MSHSFYGIDWEMDGKLWFKTTLFERFKELIRVIFTDNRKGIDRYADKGRKLIQILAFEAFYWNIEKKLDQNSFKL